MVTKNGIKLRMVFIAALFLMVLLIFTVPTFSKVYGYSHFDEIAAHIILIILFVLTVKRYKRFLWEEAVEEEKIQTI
ncbi:MAG: hypothetical protein K6A45_05025 [Lachnospiraceae bacterium]|nr:hypothetical protein [Lachnospiraceae bacterium]